MVSKLSKVVGELNGIQKCVAELLNIYDRNPELDDVISLERVVPMSLDEWSVALLAEIEDLKKLDMVLI